MFSHGAKCVVIMAKAGSTKHLFMQHLHVKPDSFHGLISQNISHLFVFEEQTLTFKTVLLDHSRLQKKLNNKTAGKAGINPYSLNS